MKKQFCSYEICLKLKELGFNEECLGYYSNEEKLILDFRENSTLNKPDMHGKYCAAPLWQQAIYWFRTTHGFYINIHQLFYSNYTQIAYFYSIEGSTPDMIHDYQDAYGDVLDASSQDVSVNHSSQNTLKPFSLANLAVSNVIICSSIMYF